MWDKELLDLLPKEEKSKCIRPGPPWCFPLASCPMTKDTLQDTNGLKIQGPWQGNFWRNKEYTSNGKIRFGLSPARLEAKKKELTEGPWTPTSEFTFSAIKCSDTLMGPAKGKYTGTIKRYCFNHTLSPPQGVCTPANCKREAGGRDSNGEKLQGIWERIDHGLNNSLPCASEFQQGPPTGFWSGWVHRECFAGTLFPVQDACVPYDCVPLDVDNPPEDPEYEATAFQQTLPDDDTNDVEVRGPWPRATNNTYSTLSCKERATVFTADPPVRYVGEVRRLCRAGELKPTKDACVRAPCDFAHEYNKNQQWEFRKDEADLELVGSWPPVKDEEYSVIRCDDKVNGPLLDWDYSGQVRRKCITGILQPIEGLCFANNCSIIEQGKPNVGGRDKGQIGLIVDEIGQKLKGPWPFTLHDQTATIDCADETNGAMDAFNKYTGIITRKCYGGRFLEVKGECTRVVLMKFDTARCVYKCDSFFNFSITRSSFIRSFKQVSSITHACTRSRRQVHRLALANFKHHIADIGNDQRRLCPDAGRGLVGHQDPQRRHG